MLVYSSILLGTALLQPVQSHQIHHIPIPNVPKDSSPAYRDLQSFSIEFAYSPDFAGNESHPNKFSKALLGNLEESTGILPKIRVGGTTQDHSIYVPDQKENIHLVYKDPSEDQPEQVIYGPGFFESYHTLADIKYIHGLSMNNSDPTHLKAATTQACKSIGSQLHLLELGNEFNLSPIMYRPSNYPIEEAKVERLTAPGSDSLREIIFAVVSYDHDLQQGKPVIIDPTQEMAIIQDEISRCRIRLLFSWH